MRNITVLLSTLTSLVNNSYLDVNWRGHYSKRVFLICPEVVRWSHFIWKAEWKHIKIYIPAELRPASADPIITLTICPVPKFVRYKQFKCISMLMLPHSPPLSFMLLYLDIREQKYPSSVFRKQSQFFACAFAENTIRHYISMFFVSCSAGEIYFCRWS